MPEPTSSRTPPREPPPGRPAPGRILLVEDREGLRRMLERALAGEGHGVASAADGAEGIALLEAAAGGGSGSGLLPFDLVLTDLKLPGATGLEVLATARRLDPALPVVVLTGYGSVPTAVEAMRRGAFHFLEKPVEIDDLFRLVEEALAERRGQLLEVPEDPAVPSSDPGDPGAPEDPAATPAESLLPEGPIPAFEVPGAPRLVGRHPKLRAATRLLERVAPTESTVLLTGESGTGKELFARTLHELSARSRGPFVAVNCAAIPEALVENELFGHEKGAFTGASQLQLGRFERASGGTLFLDEIGELPLAVQAKVLRVLEERTFERVGGGATRRADVRLVAATNRDLQAMVAEGAFRSDLYYRLEVFPIALPTLADRRSDLPHLLRHLVAELAERHGVAAPAVTREAVELLAEQPWPGNIRELANVLERAVILGGDHTSGGQEPDPGRPWVLTARSLQAVLRPLEGDDRGEGSRRTEGGADGEEEALRRALEETDGDKRKAAELLGVSYRTVLRRVQRFDLEGFPRYR